MANKEKKKKKKNEDVCHRDQHYISQAYTHTNTNLCRNGITRSMGGAWTKEIALRATQIGAVCVNVAIICRSTIKYTQQNISVCL